MPRALSCCVALGALRGGEASADEAGGGSLARARMHRDEGDRLYRCDKYGKAVDAYTAALEADRSVDGAFGGRAAALLMTSQYGAALHDAVRAVDAVGATYAAGAALANGLHDRAQVPDNIGGQHMDGDGMHAHLLLAKTLLAMGRAEEAMEHYKIVSQMGELRHTAINRQVSIQCAQEAREGVKHARSYEALVRKAFNNLHQTRDIFYVPIVGRWRSWRKASGTRDLLDLPLGAPLSCLSLF